MSKKAIYRRRTVRSAHMALAGLLALLLLFLTNINYFLYPSQSDPDITITATTANDDDNAGTTNPNPGGPDEKAPCSAVSIVEDYIHEEHYFDPFRINQLFLHKIAESLKTSRGHYSLFSPPPEV